jgi:hypothetical protein
MCGASVDVIRQMGRSAGIILQASNQHRFASREVRFLPPISPTGSETLSTVSRRRRMKYSEQQDDIV